MLAFITPEMIDGLTLVLLVGLAGALIRIWVLCAKIWDIHNVKDSEGRPVWYSQERSIEALNEILAKLSTTTDKQCRVLDALVDKIGALPLQITSELMRMGLTNSGSRLPLQPAQQGP